ncbi:MAG: CapA family protein [Firmicutes bacterium]|nr:CapA family protein [Bacillota bacterium]
MRSRFYLLFRSLVLSTLLLVLLSLSFTALANGGLLTIAFAGDIYLGGALEPIVLKNPSYPFLHIGDLCQDNDLFFANLEGPLSTRGEIYVEKTFTFRSHPQVVQCLTEGGVNVLSLANNHIMDFGPEALIDTIITLKENSIYVAGAGLNLEQARQPALIEKKDTTIAFLAYNNTFPLEFNATDEQPGTAPGYEYFIRQDVKKARSLADLVVVSFHWSSELLKEHKPYQSTLAKLAIDAGAHLVIGHHPHVIQGVEVYKHGLIAYSLGNFVFASRSKNVQDGLLLQVQFTPSSALHTATFYPLNINNYQVNFQPQLWTGDQAQRVLTELQTLSAPLGTTIEIIGDCGVIKF